MALHLIELHLCLVKSVGAIIFTLFLEENKGPEDGSGSDWGAPHV